MRSIRSHWYLHQKFPIKWRKSKPPPSRNKANMVCVVKMARSFYFLSICFLFIFYLQTISTNELYFDRVETLNDTSAKGFYNYTNLRIAKYNRTTYVFNVNVEFYTELGADITIEVQFYYNTMNNNQYTKHMMHIPPMPACSLVQKFGSLFLRTSPNITNFVQKEDGEFMCPILAVNF